MKSTQQESYHNKIMNGLYREKTYFDTKNIFCYRAMEVAQLVEQLLQSPEVCSSNPAISKFYFLSTVY